MKRFWETHKKVLRRGLLVLLALWCVWYARPMDVYDLIGSKEPAALSLVVWPQYDFPNNLYGGLDLESGDPEMETVLEALEPIRFHRSPLEVLIRFLPEGGAGKKVDPANDYRIRFLFYTHDGAQQLHPALELSFDIDGWYQYEGRRLPLFLPHGQETGRELGAFLWELSQAKNPIRNISC